MIKKYASCSENEEVQRSNKEQADTANAISVSYFLKEQDGNFLKIFLDLFYEY